MAGIVIGFKYIVVILLAYSKKSFATLYKPRRTIKADIRYIIFKFTNDKGFTKRINILLSFDTSDWGRRINAND